MCYCDGDGTFIAVAWSHLHWMLPYMLLVLAPAYRQVDPRLMLSARSGAVCLAGFTVGEVAIIIAPPLLHLGSRFFRQHCPIFTHTLCRCGSFCYRDHRGCRPEQWWRPPNASRSGLAAILLTRHGIFGCCFIRPAGRLLSTRITLICCLFEQLRSPVQHIRYCKRSVSMCLPVTS